MHPVGAFPTCAGIDMTLLKLNASKYAIILLSLVYVAAFLGLIAFHPFGKFVFKTIDDTFQVVGPLFGGIVGVYYAVRGAHPNKTRRIGWFLVGLSMLGNTAGEIIWEYYECVRKIDCPFPSWSDAGFISYYPLMIAGVLLLFGSIPAASRAKQFLDSAIAATSVAILSWFFMISGVWIGSTGSLFSKVVSAAYPLGDIVALFAALVLFRSPGADKVLRRSIVLLATGIILTTISDTAFTFETMKNTYETGSWVDPGWSVGFMLMAYACLSSFWSRHNSSDGVADISDAVRPHNIFSLLAPYALSTASLWIVVACDWRHGHRLSTSTIVFGLLLIGLVLARQALTLVENADLTSRLRRFNHDLEEIVEKRTAQIGALNELTADVNETLDEQSVFAAATLRVPAIFEADAVMVVSVDLELDNSARVMSQVGLDRRPNAFEQTMSIITSCSSGIVPFPESEAGGPGGFAMVAPLVAHERELGRICVMRWTTEFTHAEMTTLFSVGITIGAALANAQSYADAREAAERDVVTGLFNHRAAVERFQDILDQSITHNRPVAVLLADINNFRLYNDVYGHPDGDRTLKYVAAVLIETLGESAVIGRYGGDEFIAALPGLSANATLLKIEEIQARLLVATGLPMKDGRRIPVTLSFGIAAAPDDGMNRHDVLTIAESNLSKAKISGCPIVGSTQEQQENRKALSSEAFGALDSMITAVDNKDQYTKQHSEDVTEYSLWIAQELGLSDETQRILRIGCLMHDVGKICVPSDILSKPGRLTEEEYEIMKRHPYYGALIVGAIDGMDESMDVVRSHHERWDGTGYPDNLAGEEIPLLGRITAVADAFSAMTTHRPYRRGMELEIAAEEIRKHIGTQFDPEAAYAFLKYLERRLQRDKRDLAKAA
jgi:diguanylate cyclase (GGDEF)-like protein